MANSAQITGTQPYTYLDQNNRVVDGFRVYFILTDFGENYFVNVPSLDKNVVKAAVDRIVQQRKDISTI